MTAGRPTELTEELTAKIRELFLAGLEMTKIAKVLRIPYDTIVGWRVRNYKGFDTFMTSLFFERKLRMADAISDKILKLVVDKKNAKLVQVQQREAEFLRETIGKKNYSKRNELTGADGKDLPTPIMQIVKKDAILPDNSNGQNSEPHKED